MVPGSPPRSSSRCCAISAWELFLRRRVAPPSLSCFFVALQAPIREEDGEARAGGRVWVHIAGRIHAPRPRLVDQRERGRALPPAVRPDDLVVRHLRRHAGLLADVDRLLDALQQTSAFVADVGDVEAAVGRGDLGERDEFVGRGVGPRRVLQSGGQPKSPLLHRLLHKSLHLREFRLGGRAVRAPHHLRPHGPVPNEQPEVDGSRLRIEAAQKVTDGIR